ncbi:MAG: SDR family oxidoreductase [Chloroflexi bacterium]|nr:MAG: SDR family oxidoreductase [Chloroflexota bacterium]
MLLEDKVAIIYGAGGAIGGAVARAFSKAGARVFLTGRTKLKLDKVADEIRSNGGAVRTSMLDALDERAVNAYVDAVVEQAGPIDISFNLIGVGDVQKPLMEISVEEFLQPIVNAMQSHFLTTRAAARHMIERGSGVILAFGGGGPQTLPGLGGFKIALDAIEGLRRQWACELGEHGIRVVTLKTGGIPETISNDFPQRDEITASIEQQTLLKRAASLEDVGNVAVFAASDQARSITSTEINISAGAIVD